MIRVKKLLPITVLIAVILLSSVFAGCNNTTYYFYTNMPQSDFEITDGSFKCEFLDGYAFTEKEKEEIDASGYEAKGRAYYALFTDAQLVVFDNFDAEGAEDKFNEFASKVGQTLNSISKAVSSTVTDSDIYNFNNADAGATVEISQTVYNILNEAKAAYEFTGHYYNPALYYNIYAYGFSGADDYPKTTGELPDDGIINKYTELATHFAEVITFEENGKFYVTKPDFTVEVGGEILSLKLDLGGIAKGYAVDIVDGLFDSYGYKFGYFGFGGSSMLVKRHRDSGDYKIELVNPRSVKRDSYIRIPVFDEKLSTSGDNEQYYMLDGERYCHIINPETGKPVQTGIISATVIGGSAASADALTTAVMCMGRERATEFIENKLTDRKVVFVTE